MHRLLPVLALLLASTAHATTDVAMVLGVYAGDRAGPETDTDANAMADFLGITVAEAGGRVIAVQQPDLAPDEQRAYGRWNRFGLVTGHLADQVSENRRAGLFNLGLYNNCSSSLGMLGGLRHSADAPLRVGMVWIDAHGDYNTPETTLSGMLGGMPVAIAAGDGLHRMRQQSRLDRPLAREELLMVAVRDTDRREQARIDAHGLASLSTEDLRHPDRVDAAMTRLAEEVDLIYVHIDLDVLDPAEVPGHPLTAPNGPSSVELGAALTRMFMHEKSVALGLASYPHDADPDGISRRAVQRLVANALAGVEARASR
jgi:arginase